MAIRLAEFVHSGVIDCSVKGVITGELDLEGYSGPLRLNLKGTPHADIAGCVLRFKSPEVDMLDPEIADYLNPEQIGFAGDMSAAQKRKVLSMPLEDFSQASEEEREAATVWKNTLYLEWFSHDNGRIVIEAVDYEWEIDLPRWTLTEEDQKKQAEMATAAMEMHLNFAVEIFQETNEEIRAAEEEIDPKANDEFTWEKRLQESDKRAEAFHALMEEARTPEEMEALAERAYSDLGEDLEPGEPFEEEEEIEIEAYEPAQETIDLSYQIQAHCKAMIEEYYESLIGYPEQGEFLTLMVKSQTAADMVSSEGACFERGFLIAHVKREIARSQRVIGGLKFFSAEVDPAISDEVWKLRDYLVELAGQLRK